MCYRPKYLFVASLVILLTPPIASVELLQSTQVLAQSSNAREQEADRLLKKGEKLIDDKQYQAALLSFQQALAIYREINNHHGEGRTLKRIGNVYYDLKDYKQTIAYEQEALKIAQANNDRDLEARALMNIGNGYGGLGDVEQAIAYYQKSLTIAQQTKNLENQASSLQNLGFVYFQKDITKAIDFLEKASIVIRQVGGSPEDKLRYRKQETDILVQLGRYYFIFDQLTGIQGKRQNSAIFDKGIQTYEQAVILAKETGYTQQGGEAFVGLGRLYNAHSQYPKALESFGQALQMFKKSKNSYTRVGEALSSLGDVYKHLGEWAKALEVYQQALAIVKPELSNSPEESLEQRNQQALIQLNIGEIYTDAGKYQEALKIVENALRSLKLVLVQAEKTRNPANKEVVSVQETQANLSIKNACTKIVYVYALLGQAGQRSQSCPDQPKSPVIASQPNEPQNPDKSTALEKAKQQLAFAYQLGKQELEVYALIDVGSAYEKLNQASSALEYYQKAVELAKTVGNPQSQAHAFFRIGSFYNAQGKYTQALELYQQALAAAKKTNDNIAIGPILTQIGATNLAAGKFSQATTALFDAVKLYESLRVGLTDKNKVSIFEIQAYSYTLLQKALVSQNQSETALEIAERGRARAFVELLTSKLSSNSNTPPNIKSPTITQVKQVAKEQNATLVEYSINDADMYIWVVKPTGEIHFKQVDLKSLKVPLIELVAQTRQSIGARGRFTTPSSINKNESKKENIQDLYQLIIAPIASFLPQNPNERVIFIPHKSLFLVPFPALQDASGKYLIEKHTILTAPAIQILQLTHQQRQKPRGTEVLVIGNPRMPKVGNPPQTLPSLEGAEAEAKTIARLENTIAIIGDQPTKTFFKQKAPKARIIHLATHGLLEDPNDKAVPTAIALAPSANDNGLLTPAEIVDLPLGAELVVLSACNTGRGKITGDGVIGLSRSFISAGVSSIIVSLWTLDDESTAFLMAEFYKNLQQKLDKATALRNAMLATKEKYSNPLLWSAFTLIGEAQ